jgi:hypothetical protein
MDEEQALVAFEAFLAVKQQQMGVALARVPRGSERLSRGWAFYYQSREYIETDNHDFMLVGHGPVVVLDDGGIIEGGSLDRDPEALLALGPVVARSRRDQG